MNKYKINNKARGDENELVLATIQQAVEDIKHTAELYEYYLPRQKTLNWFVSYKGTAFGTFPQFEKSVKQLFEDIMTSNVIELSYYALNDGYYFWIECIERICSINVNWKDKYIEDINNLVDKLERIKI